MKFRYQARTKKGDKQVGLIEAGSREAALNILEGYELYVLSLEAFEKKSFAKRFFYIFFKTKKKDLMIFSRQLATLIGAELPLTDSLKTLYRQTENVFLKEAIREVISDIEAGLSFSQALGKGKAVFSEFFVNMVRAGEVTGRIEQVVDYMADYFEKETALLSRIKNALIYPILVIFLFFAIIVLMLTFVFPQLEPIFVEAGVKLPFFTQVLIDSGEFIGQWWWLVFSAIILFIFLLLDYFRSSEGKVVFDEISLKIPLIGGLFRKLYVARFAEACSVLIKGGVPITQAIEISANTIGNVVYKDLLKEAAAEVRKGKMMSKVLEESEYFPALVSQLISVGESTGRLDHMLSKIYGYFSREIDDTVSNLVELIQPALIVLLGVFVGVLFASILLPIYDLALKF